MNTDKNDMIQNTLSDVDDLPLSQPSVQASTDETAGVEQETSEQGESLTEDAASSAQSELSRYQTENASLREKLLESKARYTAYTLGISEERIDYAIRLAGLDDIDVNGADADKRIKNALSNVLGQIPEWSKTSKPPAQGTGSAGNFARYSGGGSNSGKSESVQSQFRSGLRR